MLASKLKELQSIRYGRLSEAVLPPKITFSVGGVDYFLTEIRNVVKTKQDVADLWDRASEQIIVLGLDLGQACVLGASALLSRYARLEGAKDVMMKEPVGQDSQMEVDVPYTKDRDDDVPIGEPCDATVPASAPASVKVVYHNLAVKQKTVYQPTFKFQRWLEEQKSVIPVSATESISDLENKLPPLRGEGASVVSNFAELGMTNDRLDGFCNGNHRFKKHKWDAQRAKDDDFKLITDRLPKLVGGSTGRKRDEANKVVIGVGLGKSSSKFKHSSLHESFQSHFVQKIRVQSLAVKCCVRSPYAFTDFVLLVSRPHRGRVNECCTSKKCPTCERFVGQVEIRHLYYPTYNYPMHRDVMAGHNVCNMVRGHLADQQRPLYLQPVDMDGNYPWIQDAGPHAEAESSTSSSSTVGQGQDQGRVGRRN
ncbi:hypothetical protein BG011_002319 [Mortierella polycephala]|uniref:Uncharacterized protein n=1 Tax=Mortierella polycephala TaxID=41804 RepID=A0A9P6Q5J4_9FUNG|nr:hypothetical protein BG011_002319 [Mortierella polycephala]